MDRSYFDFSKSEFTVAEDGLREILMAGFNPQKIPWASDLNEQGAKIKTRIDQVQKKIERLLTWIDFRNVGAGYDRLKYQIVSFQQKAIPVLQSMANRLVTFDDSEAIKVLYYEFTQEYIPLEKRRAEIALELNSAPKVTKPQKNQQPTQPNQQPNQKNQQHNYEQKRYEHEKGACREYTQTRINSLLSIKEKARSLQRKYIYSDINEFISNCDKVIEKYKKLNCNG